MNEVDEVMEYVKEIVKKVPKGVSPQAHSMVQIAGDDKYITSATHKETGKNHGILMVNHPTPSGCERWMMLVSDNRGFDTHEEACEKFKAALPEEILRAEYLESGS